MKIKITCLECDGKGWVPGRGEQETCLSCEGNKEVAYEEEELNQLFGDGEHAE